ncbi:hypothetical protein NHX12_021740 [Muraenolepis orangiensis]|uniref:Corticotropin-releasing factor domain-containing protein n=1 Tax=Muraenolepis orangiensis TaxID=630683 RepID=A0A9Q0IWA9_9TELE|nr:hypothetical protein NHX12_021740 [Muraenolepis orangiensis]
MKLNSLGTTVILLVAFSPRYECRALESPHGAPAAPPPNPGGPRPRQTLPLLPLPLLLQRLGEEYSIRVGGHGNSDSFGSMVMMEAVQPDPQPGFGRSNSRASPPLRPTRRHLSAGEVGGDTGDYFGTRSDEWTERARRSEDPPISLDLTFHLLREMMEMSRKEQMVIQAQSNRRMMELFGK